jgi:hypothetical protein
MVKVKEIPGLKYLATKALRVCGGKASHILNPVEYYMQRPASHPSCIYYLWNINSWTALDRRLDRT